MPKLPTFQSEDISVQRKKLVHCCFSMFVMSVKVGKNICCALFNWFSMCDPWSYDITVHTCASKKQHIYLPVVMRTKQAWTKQAWIKQFSASSNHFHISRKVPTNFRENVVSKNAGTFIVSYPMCKMDVQFVHIYVNVTVEDITYFTNSGWFSNFLVKTKRPRNKRVEQVTLNYQCTCDVNVAGCLEINPWNSQNGAISRICTKSRLFEVPKTFLALKMALVRVYLSC